MTSGSAHRRRSPSPGASVLGSLRRLAEWARPEPVLAAALGVLVVGSVLAIGAVHVPVALGFAALAVLMGVFALGAARDLDGRSTVPLPAWILLGLGVYSALQAVPLPISWAQALAPATTEVWSRSYAVLGEELGAATLSLDPGASLVEAAKWLGYGGALIAAAAVSRTKGAAFGVTLVFLSAAVVALATLTHGLAGLTQVYGAYEPLFHPAAWHVGPLLNPNNLAGYLNLGFLAGAGLLLARKAPVPIWLVGVGLAAILGVGVISASRGGVLALPIGLVLLLASLRGRLGRDARGEASAGRPLLVVVLAAGTLFAILGATDSVWDELYSKNADKLTTLGWIAPVIEDYPVFGVGRGAFESVFPAYHAGPGNVLYAHAENFALSWAVEWGVPVAGLALLAFGWVLRPRPLGVGRSAIATGAWTGIFVLLLQNLFDLALEVPAVCFAVAVLLGSLWGDRSRHVGTKARATPTPLRAPHPAFVAAALGIVGAATISLAAWRGAPDVASTRRVLQAEIGAADLTQPAARAALRRSVGVAMRRAPAESYFALVGGLIAQSGTEESPLPWVVRALERAPESGRAHLLLAEILASRGVLGQALFELRLAQESDPSLADAASDPAIRWTRSYEQLLPAVPAGRAGAVFLDAVASRLSRTARTALRERCDRAALELDPSRPLPRERLASGMLVSLEGGAPSESCVVRVTCEEEIDRHIDVLAQARPEVSIAAQLRARLLVVRGNAEAADALLAEACDGARDRIECLLLRVRIASLRPDPTRLAAVEKELHAAACLDPGRCAEVHAVMAQVREGRGDRKAALAHLERAVEAEPTEPRILRAADVASQAGEHARAVTLLERVLARRGGHDPALEERIASERAHLVQRLIRP